jgi:hypothetical protein
VAAPIGVGLRLSVSGIVGSSPSGGMDVCCECCVLSGRGLCDGPSLVQRSPTECGVSECDQEPHSRGLGPLGLSSHEGKKNNIRQSTSFEVHQYVSISSPFFLILSSVRIIL